MDAATETIWRGDTSIVVDVRGFLQREFTLVTTRNQRFLELVVLVQIGIGLGDDIVTFLDRRQVFDLIGHLAFFHLAVGRFQESVLVGPGVNRQAS